MGASELADVILTLHSLHAVIIAVTIYLVVQIVSVKRRSSSLPLPPGPRPLPLLGNLFDFPNEGQEWQHWAKHREKYGPISSINAFGTTFFIVNDRKIAFDLLDKRSARYSDRPLFPFGGQMIGFDRWVTTLKFYDDEFKLHRKLFHNYIGTRSAMTKFEPLEEIETRRFLLHVLNDPNGLLEHIRALPGTLILKIAYDYTTDPGGSDPLVMLADEVLSDIASKTCVFGKWTVDILPFLRHLPEWLPGMDFKRKGREWAKTVASFSDRPYTFVKHQMAMGKASVSFIQDCVEKGIFDAKREHVVKSVAASIYAGGADTTVSAIQTFYLAMTLYPDVLKRAQEEVDRVIGADRLPSFSDRKNLPYIEALVQETLRWENVLPLNIPHKAMEEDTYEGYYIPKGTLIIANIWQMTHDPKFYHDPDMFKPDRFLGENGKPKEPDPRTIAFGFGRRICPGKELADNGLYIAIAMSVAVFNINKAKDEYGEDIDPLHEYVPGVISHPKPFQCSVTPRSQRAASLVRSILDEHPPGKSDGDILQSLL